MESLKLKLRWFNFKLKVKQKLKKIFRYPQDNHEMLRRQKLLCLADIDKIRVVKPISINLPPILNGNTGTTYLPLNPFLVHSKAGYLAIVRTVNYLTRDKTYWPPVILDDGSMIKTRNFCLELNEELETTKQAEILEKLKYQVASEVSQGLEDIRLCRFDQKWWFTATSSELNQDCTSQMCLGYLEAETSDTPYAVEHLVKLTGEFTGKVEKNWLPFVHNEKLYLIYSIYPFVVLLPNLETGICEITAVEATPNFLEGYHGSSSPVPYDDESWVYLIRKRHWTSDESSDPLVYHHRLVKFNSDSQVTDISKPFYFKHYGIELCASILERENDLIFGIGIQDRQAWIFESDKASFWDAMLNQYSDWKSR
jgi:hypothetical protein